MIGYSEGLRKVALWDTLTDFVNTARDLTTTAALTLVAGSLATGVAGGWTAAKLTSRGPTDMEAARSGYERDRSLADARYLEGRIRQEGDALSRSRAPRAARVMG